MSSFQKTKRLTLTYCSQSDQMKVALNERHLELNQQKMHNLPSE